MLKALDTACTSVKKQVVELLSALCVYSQDGRQRAIDTLHIYQVIFYLLNLTIFFSVSTRATYTYIYIYTKKIHTLDDNIVEQEYITVGRFPVSCDLQGLRWDSLGKYMYFLDKKKIYYEWEAVSALKIIQRMRFYGLYLWLLLCYYLLCMRKTQRKKHLSERMSRGTSVHLNSKRLE